MAKAKAVSGIAADIAAMKAIGMTDEQIQARIIGAPAVTINAEDAMKPGGFARVEPALTAPQRQDQNLGPDPAIVARHQEMLKDYKAPPVEKTYEVTLPARRADYIERWAAYETAVREAQAKKRNAPLPPPITAEKAIEIIVGRYWQNDPDRALMAQGGSMSRAAFEQTVAPLIPKTA